LCAHVPPGKAWNNLRIIGPIRGSLNQPSPRRGILGHRG
jgi:hypothetical protein